MWLQLASTSYTSGLGCSAHGHAAGWGISNDQLNDSSNTTSMQAQLSLLPGQEATFLQGYCYSPAWTPALTSPITAERKVSSCSM